MSDPANAPLAPGNRGTPPVATRRTRLPGPSRRRPWWPLMTLAIVAVAIGLRLTALQMIGTRNVYLTFFPAVVMAALYGGWWAGLTATALSALAADYFLIPPLGFAMPDRSDLVGMGVFLVGGVMISAITEAMHRAQGRARAAELEAHHTAELQLKEEALRLVNHELRRLNRVLKALSNCSQALLRLSEEQAYLDEVCRIMQRDCGYAMVWIGLADQDPGRSLRPVAQAGFEPGFLESLHLTWAESGRGLGPTGTAIRTGRPVGCRNTGTAPEFARWREEARSHSVASVWALPLMIAGRAIGSVTIGSREADGFFAGETTLLAELADDVGAALTALRLRAAHAEAERALRVERDAGLDREQELAAIYDHAPLVMLLLNADYRIQKANRQAAELAAADAATLCGRRAGEALHCIHAFEDERGCGFGAACGHCLLRRTLEQTIVSGSGQHQIEVAISVRTAVPPRRTFLLSTTRLNVRGEVRVLATMQDITRRKQAEEALQRTQAELERRVADRTARLRALAAELTQSEERERRRIAQVLHDDLQQLLVGARLRLEAVRGRVDARPVAAELQRVEQLLDESGNVARDLSHELSPPVLHEHGLVAGIRWLGRWMAEKHGLAVEVEAESVAEPAESDVKVLLYQSVRELLFNVVKHSGVRAARVTLETGPGGCLEVTVSDRGRGLTEEESGSESRPQGGYGLFAIRERLVTIGGRMEITNAPEGGCSCRLIAPIASQEPSGVPAAGAQAPVGNDSARGKAGESRLGASSDRAPVRVLLVDDHKILRDGLSVVLNARPDIEVVGLAADGLEAIDLAGRFQPHVVVMDVNMPRLDGIAATRHIAAAWPQIKVIGLTMYEDEVRREAMFNAGAVGCLVKTGRTDDLINAIFAATGSTPLRPPPLS